MPRLFIAGASDSFTETLNKALCSDWEIHISQHNTSIYDYLLTIRPNNPDRSDNAPTHSLTKHLDTLGVRASLSGYRCLLVAIQLFSQDHARLLKEIYPEVAKQCNLNDAICVEHVIRTAIRDAWYHRSEEIWNLYFPGRTHCPSNKEFIVTLAELP